MPAAPPHPALAASAHLLPALRAFPAAYRDFFPTVASLADPVAHRNFYSRADMVHSGVAILTVLTSYVYIMQQITGNASQVDGLWTFLPLVFTAHVTFQPAIAHLLDPPPAIKVSRFFGSKQTVSGNAIELLEPRLVLIFALQVLWSARLTYNAYRRKMFQRGEEDYRWPILRQRMSRLQWELLSFFFIAIAQLVLLALPSFGSYIIHTAASKPSTGIAVPNPPSKLIAGDYVLAGLFVLNLTTQYIADHQQWVYQNFKRGRDAKERPLSQSKQAGAPPYSAADVKRGFVTKGLWAFSRHPNFACEQTTWWLLYLFVPLTFYPAEPAMPAWRYFVTYAISAPLAMNALFIASTLFSEAVSAEKYPEYADYQRRVGMFWPFDTAARSIYYNFVASKEARERVYANVWGSPIEAPAQGVTNGKKSQ